MENTQAKDPLTGELFIPKRSNQIYSSRATQIRFNNEKQKRSRKENAVINRHITRNKKILKAILSDAKEIIKSKEFLSGAGFRFEYYTHYFSYGVGRAYCNYEYCIVLLENGNYKIFKNV
ncbi:MAG TPA: hypothetical protein VI757_05800 [Bacteroidia bacterium]|nr:hypothetical protein [Bacteroidia bacterium]